MRIGLLLVCARLPVYIYSVTQQQENRQIFLLYGTVRECFSHLCFLSCLFYFPVALH